MGPAFALATLAFSPNLGPDTGGPVRSHPPWQIRFPVIFRTVLEPDPGLDYDALPSVETTDASVDVAYILRSWRDLNEQFVTTLSPEKQELYDLLEPFQEWLITLARQQCGTQSYDRRRFQREVPPLVGRLANGIPPNEVEIWDTSESKWEFQIPSLPGILNAAWVYHLGTLPWEAGSAATDRGLQDVTRFTRLIDKAVELAEVQRSWSTAT